MKEKLKGLAEELLQEVKNLKDLTKEELPLIAKEYVRFSFISNLIEVFVGICITLGGISLAVWIPKNDGVVLGVLLAVSGAVLALVTGIECLAFKLMPRRKAIEAITELFK